MMKRPEEPDEDHLRDPLARPGIDQDAVAEWLAQRDCLLQGPVSHVFVVGGDRTKRISLGVSSTTK